MLFQLYNRRRVINFNGFDDYNTIIENLRERPGILFEDGEHDKFLRVWGPNVVWKRPREICKNPYFIKNGSPSRFDVLQGEHGDCWQTLAFQLLASNKLLFQRVVPTQFFGEFYCGCFHFRLYKLGTWYDVVIDDRLPVVKGTRFSLTKARSKTGDVFWGALLEKALTKFYPALLIDLDFYTDGLDPGFLMTCFQTLTGGIVCSEEIKSTKQKFWIQNRIESSFLYQDLIALSTKDGAKYGLMSHHGYPVIDIKSVDKGSKWKARLLRLMNPKGYFEWKGWWADNDSTRWDDVDSRIRNELGYAKVDDGQFFMDMDDIFKYFGFVTICHLSPSNFMISRMYDESPMWYNWNLEVVRGEWVKFISAGGSFKSIGRLLNPQYVFSVGKEGQEKVDDCPTLIELTMMNRMSRQIKQMIAFYLYELSPDDKPPFRDSMFYITHKAIDEKPDFASSFHRSFVQRHYSELGKRYLLIPCAVTADFEAEFAIRIMSHYEIKVFDSSAPKMSKASPMETESVGEVDRKLVELFFKASQGAGEIDWIGLREILNGVLVESENLISRFISYLLKFVGNMFLPTHSYEESYKESLFSKDECRRLIAMVDDDHSGKLNFSEFIKLWNRIRFWTEVFDKNKEDEHGLPTRELRDALCASGYDLSTHAIHSFSHLYADERSYITLKDFILCGVTLETVLNLCASKKRYDERTVFTLQEWVKNTLIL